MKRFLRRLTNWLLALAITGLLLGGAVVAVASLLFLRLRGIEGVELPEALWCWLPYWFAYHQDPDVRQSLLIAIGTSGAVVAVLVGTFLYAVMTARPRLRPARPGLKAKPPVRAASDTHGNAEWMSMKEALVLFRGPNPGYGGVVVGEAYRVDADSVVDQRFNPADRRTWGKGGCAPLLIDPCEGEATHGLVFAGSGGYKTTAIAIPTLTSWTGPAVVLDPAGQLGDATTALRQKMGHRTVAISPGLAGFNPLDWIDTRHPLAETHVGKVVQWLTGETAGPSVEKRSNDDQEIFQKRAKELIECLLADLLWSDRPAAEKTLRTLRQRVATPEKRMKGLLAEVHEESNSPLAREIAGTLMDVFHETFSGMYTNAVSMTKWLTTAAYADMVSGEDFRTADLREGRLTVYVQVPMETLHEEPALVRVVIGALLNSVYMADGNLRSRVLFLLDEVNFLGRMKMLEQARDAGRKHGITLLPMWQSLGQLTGTWGQSGRAAWFESSSWRLFAAVSDHETARLISETAGKYTVLRRTEGSSTGSNSGSGSGSRSSGRNEGLSEGIRELIRPDEVMVRMRTDEQILFYRNAKPLRCGRAIYFRRPEMVAKVAADRFRGAAE